MWLYLDFVPLNFCYTPAVVTVEETTSGAVYLKICVGKIIKLGQKVKIRGFCQFLWPDSNSAAQKNLKNGFHLAIFSFPSKFNAKNVIFFKA